MPRKTFDQYLFEVAEYYREYSAPSKGNIRMGQAYVNCLPIDFPPIPSSCDPFYNDGNLANFLVWVESRWPKS